MRFYLFAACPVGFISFNGGIAGNGISLHAATLEKCKLDCEANHECRSFSHSTEKNICKLSREPLPTNQILEDGDQFCSKRGLQYCINYMNIYSVMPIVICITMYAAIYHTSQSVLIFSATVKTG